MSKVTYYRSAERPALELTLYDDDGTLIDFSTGYTFSFKIGTSGATAALTKTSGITGAATAPNVTVTWSAGELNLTPGNYRWQLTCTTSALDRVFSGQLAILDTIT